MRILLPTLSLHEHTQHVFYSCVEKIENTRILNTSIWTISLPRTEPTNERHKNMLAFLSSAAEEAESAGRSDEKHMT